MSALETNKKLCKKFKEFAKKLIPSLKLKELIRLASITIPNNPIDYYKRRNKKHKTKKPCFCCAGRARCQHHVVQLQNGGFDSAFNRVPICDDCHRLIHPWMVSNAIY
jgi:hypothetical protein